MRDANFVMKLKTLDAKYLLIGCQRKLDIWDNIFKNFLDTQLSPVHNKFIY